jgi:hypothetical protein
MLLETGCAKTISVLLVPKHLGIYSIVLSQIYTVSIHESTVLDAFQV